MGPYRWAWATAWQAHPLFLTIVLVTSVIEATLPVGMVWVGKLVIDAVVAHDAEALMWNIGVEAALTVALLITQVGSGHALGLLHIRARFHGHMKLLERAARVPYVCFEDPAFYDAMNRALPEANGRPMAVVHHTIGVGSAGIGLLGATALLSGVSPWVGAAMIASSLPRFANERWFQRAWFHLRSARAPLHRELEYFETLLTKDDAAREIRLLGVRVRRVVEVVAVYARAPVVHVIVAVGLFAGDEQGEREEESKRGAHVRPRGSCRRAGRLVNASSPDVGAFAITRPFRAFRDLSRAPGSSASTSPRRRPASTSA